MIYFHLVTGATFVILCTKLVFLRLLLLLNVKIVAHGQGREVGARRRTGNKQFLRRLSNGLDELSNNVNFVETFRDHQGELLRPRSFLSYFSKNWNLTRAREITID